MKKLLGLIVLIMILISGCSNVDLSSVSDEDLERVSEKAVVCNVPYIRMGDSCCLDNNGNSICDIDENLVNEKSIDLSEVKNESSEIISENNELEDKSIEIKEDSKEISEKETIIEIEENKENDSEKESISNFKELKLNVIEMDDSLFFEWNEYDLKDNFEWYYLSQSLTHPEDEEKVISTSGLIRDMSKNNHLLNSYTESGKTYYFWVDVKLKNSSKIRSNIIEYYVEKTIDYDNGEEGFQRCKYLVITSDNSTIYTKGARYEIDSKSKCIEEFEKTIDEDENFLCSGSVIRKELIYRDSENDDFKVIQVDTCSVEDFNEVKTVSFVDGDSKVIKVGSIEYKISTEDIFSNGIGKVSIDDSSENFIKIFEKIKIGDLYIQVLNNLVSSRSSIQSFSEIAIGNYDFNLNSSDLSEICYENGQSSQEETSIFAIISGNEFEVKKSYCSSNSILVQYNCDGPNDDMQELEINCEFGCEGNRCLKITDVGCNKDELGSGIINLNEQENMALNNLTTLEILEVNEDTIEIKVNDLTKIIKMCEVETIDNTTILVHNIVESSRDGVKDWVEFSFN